MLCKTSRDAMNCLTNMKRGILVVEKARGQDLKKRACCTLYLLRS